MEKDASFNEENLIWVDLEMTGLQPEVNRIIEVAAIVTDKNLNILHECPVIAIHQSEAELAKMDEWNRTTHTRTGLVDRVRASVIDEEAASDLLLKELSAFVPAGKSPICGNTIGQDRRFMARWMPRLEAFFHYRYIDVSTIKELVRRWKPEILHESKKPTMHEALSDIRDSIDELRFYREKIMKI